MAANFGYDLFEIELYPFRPKSAISAQLHSFKPTEFSGMHFRNDYFNFILGNQEGHYCHFIKILAVFL